MKRIPWIVMGWVGALAAAPIAWWLVGDVSESLGEDRAWAAPAWLVENTRTFGIYGLIAIVAALVVELVGVHFHKIDRQTVAVFLPLLAAAAVVACGYRVTTSFSHDTNIRTGVVVLVGGPIVLALAGIHIGWLRADLRRLRGY